MIIGYVVRTVIEKNYLTSRRRIKTRMNQSMAQLSSQFSDAKIYKTKAAAKNSAVYSEYYCLNDIEWEILPVYGSLDCRENMDNRF